MKNLMVLIFFGVITQACAPNKNANNDSNTKEIGALNDALGVYYRIGYEFDLHEQCYGFQSTYEDKTFSTLKQAEIFANNTINNKIKKEIDGCREACSETLRGSYYCDARRNDLKGTVIGAKIYKLQGRSSTRVQTIGSNFSVNNAK